MIVLTLFFCLSPNPFIQKSPFKCSQFKNENKHASNANFLLFSSLFFSLSLFIFSIDSGTQFGHLTQDQHEEQFYFFFNRSVYYFFFFDYVFRLLLIIFEFVSCSMFNVILNLSVCVCAMLIRTFFADILHLI